MAMGSFRRAGSWLSLALLVLALSGPRAFARKPTADEIQRAKAYFEAGRALYGLGQLDEALRQFAAGYQLVPRPEFLLNMAQTYRRQGRFADAQQMYRRYLEETPPSDPVRKEVNAVLALLDDMQQAGTTAPPPEASSAGAAPSGLAASSVPTGGAATPGSAPAAGAPLASAPLAVARAPLAATTPGPEARRRKLLAWTLPTAGVLLATGLTLGLYFGLRSSGADCGAVPLGCLDATHPR